MNSEYLFGRQNYRLKALAGFNEICEKRIVKDPYAVWVKLFLSGCKNLDEIIEKDIGVTLNYPEDIPIGRSNVGCILLLANDFCRGSNIDADTCYENIQKAFPNAWESYAGLAVSTAAFTSTDSIAYLGRILNKIKDKKMPSMYQSFFYCCYAFLNMRVNGDSAVEASMRYLDEAESLYKGDFTPHLIRSMSHRLLKNAAAEKLELDKALNMAPECFKTRLKEFIAATY